MPSSDTVGPIYTSRLGTCYAIILVLPFNAISMRKSFKSSHPTPDIFYHRRLDEMPTPIVCPGIVQPNLAKKFRANISPKPSMTPFTKGRKRLIVSEEARAHALERLVNDLSNTESVAEGVTAGTAGAVGVG